MMGRQSPFFTSAILVSIFILASCGGGRPLRVGDSDNLTDGDLFPSPLATPLTFTPAPIPAAAPLVDFSASMGTVADGDIILQLTYPTDSSGYKIVQVRRKNGATPPANCSDGQIVRSFSAPYQSGSFVDSTGVVDGSTFSYRACIYNTVDNVTDFNVIAGVQAKFSSGLSLAGLSGNAGLNQGEINVSVVYPADTSAFREIIIRRQLGLSPPLDCSQGVEAFKSLGPFISGVFVDQTGAQYGESFSYRICLRNAINTISSAGTLNGIGATDIASPPQLQSFTASTSTSIGKIQLNWAYPTSILDYARLEIRRIAGANAPAANCLDGSAIVSLTSFSQTSYQDSLPSAGNAFSYRVCIYDRRNNLTATNTAVNVQSGDAHYIFVTSTRHSGNLGGLSGADSICQQRSTASGSVAPPGTYKALLSDGITSAKDRINITKRVVNLVGLQIATNETDLWDGSIENPIIYDEAGISLNDASRILKLRDRSVWSATNPNGTKKFTGSSNNNCFNWTSGTAEWGTKKGYLFSTSGKWLDAGDYDDEHCNYLAGIYCISQ